MKALTLIQPYAELMAIGVKHNETRGWPTKIIGDVAIHAAKNFPIDYRVMCGEKHFRDHLPKWHMLPTACVVAVGTLVKCVRSEPELKRLQELGYLAAQCEIAFGNYNRGRFIHVYTGVRRLIKPVPCRGALGYWNLPPEIEALVRAQL